MSLSAHTERNLMPHLTVVKVLTILFGFLTPFVYTVIKDFVACCSLPNAPRVPTTKRRGTRRRKNYFAFYARYSTRTHVEEGKIRRIYQAKVLSVFRDYKERAFSKTGRPEHAARVVVRVITRTVALNSDIVRDRRVLHDH